MNTTGNPGGGESGSGAEPVGDYGYSGGYGYGPGYGDPDGGAGYSYAQPGYADPAEGGGFGYGPQYAVPGDDQPTGAGYASLAGPDQAAGGATPANGAAAAAEQVAFPPVVADTPALRGYPGGPGVAVPAEGTPGPGGREIRGLRNPSVWQQAQRAWRNAGVEWQRPVTDWEPAEAEWERVQAAPPSRHRGLAGRVARPGGASGKRSSRLSARSLTKSLNSPLAPPGTSFTPAGTLNPPGAPRPPGPSGPPGTAAQGGTVASQQGTVVSPHGAAVTPLAAAPGAPASPAGTTLAPPGPAARPPGRPPTPPGPAPTPPGPAPTPPGPAPTPPGPAPTPPGPAPTPPGPAPALPGAPLTRPGPAYPPPGAALPTRPGLAFPPQRGGWHVRREVWLAAIAIVVVAVLVVGGLLIFGGGGSSGRSGALAPYPPARPAGADFTGTPGLQSRGIFQSVSAVAASGSTVVAVGSQTGQWIPRAQFFVSADGGQSWRLARVRAPGGAAPSPSDTPLLVAGPALPGGRGGWLAVGTGAAWTSPDGSTWTLAPGRGIAPVQAGDRVLALTRTGGGFLAVGENVPGGNPAKSSPVAWTSANGLTWQRLSGGSLKLNAGGARVLDLARVAARGSDVIVTGRTVTTHIHGTHRTTSESDKIWLSTDGGSSWAPVHLPYSGEVHRIDGVVATGSGFVAVRHGKGTQAGTVAAYVSANGSSWRHTATLTAPKPGHLRITGVGGSDQGAVVAGQLASGAKVGYVSTNGTSWRSVASLGSPAQTLAGVTVTAGGTVVAAGATVRSVDAQQPYLALAGAQARTVNFGAIPGATGPALGVSGIAVAGRTQVAVGSANGYPAIWSAGSQGRWHRAGAAVLARPGLGTLASVVHGRPGWLAVGAAATGVPSRPVVVVSPDGTSWQAADGEPAFAGPGISVSQAAAGPSGYVIVGKQVIPGRTITSTKGKGRHKHVTRQVIPAQTVAAAWWSAGLTGWARGTGAAKGDLDGPGSPQMMAVTAAGTGFVAVGTTAQSPAVWTSPDGKSWQLTRLRSPDGAGTALLQKVAAQRNLIVATGTETTAAGGTVPFAAYSMDGGSIWAETRLTAPGGFVSVTALTAAGRGFEAVGTAGPPGRQRVVVWSSRDGIRWTAREPVGAGLNSRGSQAITALTASGSRVTGAGYLATPANEQPTLWQAGAAG